MPNRRIFAVCWTFAVFLLTCSCALANQPAAKSKPASAPAVVTPEAPVIVNSTELFSVRGVLSLTAAARAEMIEKRIEALSKDVALQSQQLSVSNTEASTDIVAGDLIVMSVTDQDISGTGKTRQELAAAYAQQISELLAASRHEYSLKSLLLGALYALLATAILVLILRLLGMVFRKIYVKLNTWRGTLIPSLRIQKFELVPADRITDFAVEVARLFRLAIVLGLLYSYLSLVLGFFPWTRGYAHMLLGYVVAPVKVVGSAITSYLPNLVFILVIFLISFYIIKFVKTIFNEIEKETIAIPNFYPDWAQPTYKIARTLILALMIVVAFPYFPGAASPAFRGVSIFLGVLVSLGSTSAVANIVAGVILT